MNREQLLQRISLRGLGPREIRSYVHAATGIEPPAALISRIEEETEGNPFFLSEVVNLMAEEGAFRSDRSDSLSDIVIPEGVKEALGRRLDRLSLEANELLGLASVVGREFEHALLAALAEHSEDELLRLLEEALAARVIEETGRVGEYRFTHALMQETLLGELSAARRVRLHGQIAEELERLHGGGSSNRVNELALHFGESAVLNNEHRAKAAAYGEAAGDRAMVGLAAHEAIEHFDQALSLLPEAGDDALARAPLLVKLSRAIWMGGNDQQVTRAPTLAIEAMRLLAATDRPTAAAEAALLAAREHPAQALGGVERLQVCHEALSILGNRDLRLRANLLAQAALSALAWINAPGVDDARSLLVDAANLAANQDWPEVEAFVEDARARIANSVGDYRTAAQLHGAAAERHRRLHDASSASVSLGQRAMALLLLGEYDEIEHVLDERIRLAIANGLTRDKDWGRVVEGAERPLSRRLGRVCGSVRSGQRHVHAWAPDARLGRGHPWRPCASATDHRCRPRGRGEPAGALSVARELRAQSGASRQLRKRPRGRHGDQRFLR